MSAAPRDESPARSRALVIIPTYNEIDNLSMIMTKLFASSPDVDLLIVDDGSPDGTGAAADEMATRDPRVHVMHRTAKLGLGSAYVMGFTWGLERGYDFLIEMDADGSHPAETLPAMLTRAAVGHEPALVIGSRWIKGGSVENWPKRREALSRCANLYVRAALGIRVHDATAGFRVYSAYALREIPLAEVDAHGYYFQVDMTVRILDHGHRIDEVPIAFRERIAGESKMSGSIISEAMKKVTLGGLQRRGRSIRRLVSRGR